MRPFGLPSLKKPLLPRHYRIESGKTLVPLVVPSKRYFASPFDVDNKCAGDTGKVSSGLALDRKLAGSADKRAYRFFLSLS